MVVQWLYVDTRLGLHIIPRNDLVAHESSKNCVCGPRVDSFVNKSRIVAWQYIHESLDRREDHL